jgi:hypothetical protein
MYDSIVMIIVTFIYAVIYIFMARIYLIAVPSLAQELVMIISKIIIIIMIYIFLKTKDFFRYVS